MRTGSDVISPPFSRGRCSTTAGPLRGNSPPGTPFLGLPTPLCGPSGTTAGPNPPICRRSPPCLSSNPILQRYHGQLLRHTAPPAAAFPNPFNHRTSDKSNSYYLTLSHPWNVCPPDNAVPFTDYDKLKKLAPVFSGRPDSYVLWRQIFIPSVHMTKASVNWKVSALLACFNMSDPELRHIADGIPADGDGYRLAIRRLEKHYGHPLGVLGARQRALAAITRVKRADTPTIHRLYLKLEDLINEFERLNRPADAFGSHLYEEVIRKLDPDLLSDFHLWNSAVAKHTVPCAVSLLAWLDELLDVRRAGLAQAPQQPHSPAQAFQTSVSVKFVCPFDNQEHRIIKCPLFQAATPNDRRKMLQKVRRCFSCFEEGHDTSSCPRNVTCKECQNKHHTLLHGAKFFKKRTTFRAHTTQVDTDSDSAEDDEEEEVPTVVHQAYHAGARSRVSLQTVPIQCVNPLNGRVAHLNCMLDSGATASFISQKAAEELGLQGRAALATIKGFNGASFEQEIMVSHLLIRTTNTDHEVSVQVVKDPAASYKPFDWTKVQHLHDHLRGLPLSPPVPDRVVDIMLGQATPHLLSAVSPDVAPQEPGGPIARHTALGWTVGGPTGLSPSTSDESSFYVLKCHAPVVATPWSATQWSSFKFNTTSPSDSQTTKQDKRPPAASPSTDRALHELVQRMFDVDDAAGPLANSVRDEQVFAYLRKNMIMVDGRYQLPVLWKKRPPPLTNNYAYALSRLKSLEASKLFASPTLQRQYLSQIEEWTRRQFVEEVGSDTPADDKAYYLAHFGVHNPHKPSSQLRTVMDAAAKPNGRLSLNDHVHKGPKLVTELVTVLLRFRRHNVAVGADIEKMFHKLQMPEEDRDFHRFLWRTSPGEQPKVFRWRSHVFGNAGSPCVAIFAIKEHARQHRLQYPSAAETLIHSTLVDDSLDSRPTIEEAAALLSQLTELLAKADMPLKKIVSSHPEVLRNIPQECITPGLRLSDYCNKDAPLPTLKTLGVIYQAEGDYFTFSLDTPPTTVRWTKRTILQFEARLYDPHGLVLPFVLAARMILQHLWRERVDWDDPCPAPILKKWKEWLAALPGLQQVRIPRCIHPVHLHPLRIALHIFCDASAEAYAAVAYVVAYFDDEETTSRLLLARGRVAPIKQVSIPRLELMAAELALNLAFCIVAAYSLSMTEVNFWSDSATVLCWLHNDTRVLTTFVGTRTAKIQRATSVANWRHVPTDQNPADIPSRGLFPSQIGQSKLWAQGPTFLCTGEWPSQPESVQATAAALEEVKKGAQFSFVQTKPSAAAPLQDGYNNNVDADFPLSLHKYSSWTKIVRIIAWCLRLRYPSGRTSLAGRELWEAERRLLLHLQRTCFSRTFSDLTKGLPTPRTSTIYTLQPRLSMDGLLRANSRLRLATDLPFATKFPIIVPKDHHCTTLLIRLHHIKTLHGAQNIVMNQLLRKYWIVNLRALTRKVANECTACKRRAPQPFRPPMAPLPPVRLGPTHDNSPFSNIGLDMAGPFAVKNSPLEATKKRYFIIFTCLATRAVHLEPLLSASAHSHLCAFERFITRRRADGTLASVYADQGSNIRAAPPELQGLLTPKVGQRLEDKFPPTQWHFNPPSGSHFGGAFERLVAAVKRGLYHALPADLPTTDEEFMTTLVVVEGILNSRPLSFITADSGGPLPLTPADALGLPPYRMVAREPKGGWNDKRPWHKHQARLDAFWKRFKDEIIPYMQTTSKWHAPDRSPKVGDVVTLLDDQCRGRWPIARIISTRPSADGVVRRVTLQLANGSTLCRPTHVLGRLLQVSQDH